MTLRLICDPPSGWKYGFPKLLPIGWEDDERWSLVKWLISYGYPKDSAAWASKHCRYWEKEIEDE